MNDSSLIVFVEYSFEKVLNKNKKIRNFHEGMNLSKAVYIRYIIEGVNRIHLNNEIDALALMKAAQLKQNHISKKIAQYLSEEISHDEIIVKDLESFGLTHEEVAGTDVFFSTKLLIGFLNFSIEKDGYLPSMLWNWFLEWYSDKYNPIIVASANSLFGNDKTTGIERHLEIDKALNHSEFLDEIINHFYKTDESKVKYYLKCYIDLVEMFFIELMNVEDA